MSQQTLPYVTKSKIVRVNEDEETSSGDQVPDLIEADFLDHVPTQDHDNEVDIDRYS